MDLTLIRTSSGFRFAYDTDLEKAKRFKIGDPLKCKITLDRNYEFHKKYFALMRFAFENQERYQDKEQMRFVYTLKAGYSTPIQTDKGVVFMPKSVAFDKMEEDEFEQLYSAMIDVVIKELGVEEGDLLDELLNYT